MTKIFVCSPYRGNHCANGTEHHLKIAREICQQVAYYEGMPIAPHLFFPQFLNDNDQQQRDMGCSFSMELLRECQRMIVYTGCCGISAGMHGEIAEAEKLGIPITYTNNL